MGYMVARHLALRPQRDHRRRELVPPVFRLVINCATIPTLNGRVVNLSHFAGETEG